MERDNTLTYTITAATIYDFQKIEANLKDLPFEMQKLIVSAKFQPGGKILYECNYREQTNSVCFLFPENIDEIVIQNGYIKFECETCIFMYPSVSENRVIGYKSIKK